MEVFFVPTVISAKHVYNLVIQLMSLNISITQLVE